jgi:hypothetical protein
MAVYYVTVDGKEVEGPFDERNEAQRRRDDLLTNEVGGRYRVEKRES